MSVQASEVRYHLFSPKFEASLLRLLSLPWRRSRQGHLPHAVSALPDRMLLDIGIDPRRVPNPLAEAISRPDLLQRGVPAPPYRSTARS